jgi:alpha-maltose-1-phosphate synthase
VRVALLTREFPPEVYGGAGVHVEYLSRELTRHTQLEVHCFGAPRSAPVVAGSYEPWQALGGAEPHLAALRTMSVDLAMTAGVAGADLVHSHTWYANLAGHLAKLVYGIPHVATTHSLEPLRPWKAEQLSGGYALSSFCERTALEAADAIIAVSGQMRADVLASYPSIDPWRVRVIHNGIDPDEYQPRDDPALLARHGIDPDRPIVLFVGRITRQKGLVHLLDAAEHLDPEAQLVLCAGAPDTPELLREVRTHVDDLRSARKAVVWIEEVLDRPDVVALLSAATLFACPSIYEPFGLVNVEAMACEAAVVASAVGGIPEVVADGETGYLVPFTPGDDPFGSPRDRSGFARDFAARMNAVLADADRARAMGRAGRERVLARFSWPAIAQETVALYHELVGWKDTE